MDIKSILRVHRYSEIEQRPNPRTGERRTPPSIKFGVFLLALAVVGAIFFVYQSTRDGVSDGAPQDTGTTSDANNTTNGTPAVGGEQDAGQERSPRAAVFWSPSVRSRSA